MVIEDFEKYVSSPNDKKLSSIEKLSEQIDTFLKVIGILMDALYKDFRGYNLEKLVYVESE
jgi:hypothetical protein